MHFLYKAYSF